MLVMRCTRDGSWDMAASSLHVQVSTRSSGPQRRRREPRKACACSPGLDLNGSPFRWQEEWLPHLQHCIERINETFSRSFATIGCAGEVILHEADDYDHFAIHIRCGLRRAFRL